MIHNQAFSARMLAPPQNFDGTLITYGSDGTLSAYTYKDIPSEFLGPITQPPLTRPQRENAEPPQVVRGGVHYETGQITRKILES